MIHLFGCSYVDNNYKEAEWSWPQRISETYESKNHGVYGSGPDYSLKKIREVTNSGIVDKNKDLMIFFIPEYFRMDFSFFRNPHEHVLTYSLWTNRPWMHKKFKKEFGKDIYGWTKGFWYHYLMYDDNPNMHVQKIYAMINHYASFFKRVLVLPTDAYHKNEFIDSVSKMLTAPNITFEDIILDRISSGEGPRSDYYNDEGLDIRPQHLSKVNHEIMYDLLKNWIDHNKTPEDHFKYTKKW